MGRSPVNDETSTQLERSPSSSSQYELEEPVQFDWVHGKAVPRLAARSQGYDTPNRASTDPRQSVLQLTKSLQLSLPVDRSVHGDGSCQRGVKATYCQHTVDRKDVTIVPLYCGKASCKKSEQRNGNRRAKRLLHGEKEKISEEGEIKKLGIWKMISNFDLGVMVFTLPEHLRLLLSSTEYLSKWNKVCQSILTRMLIKNGSKQDANYAIKVYLHPTNDEGVEYKPHLNFLFPLAYESGGKLYKQRSFFPKSWFTDPYWRNEYKQEVEKAFGFKLFTDSEDRELNFFYEIRTKDYEKFHAVKYFSRQFSGFTLLNGKRFNPRGLGLLSPKRSELLGKLLDQLPDVSEVAEQCDHGRKLEVACNWRDVHGDTEEAVIASLVRVGVLGPSGSPYFKRRTSYGLPPGETGTSPPLLESG